MLRYSSSWYHLMVLKGIDMVNGRWMFPNRYKPNERTSSTGFQIVLFSMSICHSMYHMFFFLFHLSQPFQKYFWYNNFERLSIKENHERIVYQLNCNAKRGDVCLWWLPDHIILWCFVNVFQRVLHKSSNVFIQHIVRKPTTTFNNFIYTFPPYDMSI